MVGHTGNIPAAIKAVEFVDDCLGQVAATLREVGGEMVVIADHGNAEKMVDEDTQQAHTAHTINPVPFIYVGRKAEMTKKLGKLIDLAPTMLRLIGIDVPKEMTGECLLNLSEIPEGVK